MNSNGIKIYDIRNIFDPKLDVHIEREEFVGCHLNKDVKATEIGTHVADDGTKKNLFFYSKRTCFKVFDYTDSPTYSFINILGTKNNVHQIKYHEAQRILSIR